MTPAQKKIYTFIQGYIEEYGYSPSLTEIASGIGISPNSISLISRSIHALVKGGYLKFYKSGYRNVQVIKSHENDHEKDHENGFSLPLMGCIAAGAPIEAVEDQQAVDLGALLSSSEHFLLKVKGDSMVDEGIFDGDLVICKHAKYAREGEIVVALIDQHEATLKSLSYKIKDRITLVPANPALKPKAYLPHRVQIQGVFVGLLRLPAAISHSLRGRGIQ